MIGRALSADAQVRYAHVDALDTARARIVVVPWLTPGVSGMTVGRVILLRRGYEQSVPLIAHELVHVEQWRRLGGLRFLKEYLSAYFGGRRAGLGHHAAYRAIPLEHEARARTST